MLELVSCFSSKKSVRNNYQKGMETFPRVLEHAFMWLFDKICKVLKGSEGHNVENDFFVLFDIGE